MTTLADRGGPSAAARFWNLILASAALLAGMAFYAFYFVDKLTVDANGVPVIRAEYAERWEDKLPELLGYQDELFAQIGPKLDSEVDRQVDWAFEPVYGQIENYADFHYSIRGQYTEITAVVIGEFVDTISTRIYDSVDFEGRMNAANEEISGLAEAEIGAALTALRERTRNAVGLSFQDMPLFDGAVQLTQSSVATRFAAARAAGFVVGRTLTRQGMRLFVTSLARALGGKIATRAAARTAGIGAAASGGAAAGSVVGPVGTAVGGAVGALVGWLVTDAVAISIDEAINRDSFEAEVRQMIDDQKLAIKVAMKEKIATSMADIDGDIDAEFDRIKTQRTADTVLGD
ncbi:MAG: hypothetical protein AAF909_00290 [Pseudomonadota bacterium]